MDLSKLKRLLMYSLLFMMGCSRLESGPVSCRLGVEVLQNKCRLSLIVTNTLDSEIVLQFPTSQQYDFIVKARDDGIIWQWSKDMVFAQMLTSLIMTSGEGKIFAEECMLPPGNYVAQGILTTTPENLHTEWIEFTIYKQFSIYDQKQPVLKGKVTKILDKLYLLGEDGTAYLIENPSKELEGKTIEATSYKAEPIPGTIDKKIYVEEFNSLDPS